MYENQEVVNSNLFPGNNKQNLAAISAQCQIKVEWKQSNSYKITV